MAEAAAGWTDERVELLARLWGDGLSASQIAGLLGGGVTRNAVIGKVHRLGLSGRGKTGQPAPARPAKLRPAAVATQPQPGGAPAESVTAAEAGPPREAALVLRKAQEPMIPVSQRVSILDLRDSMCRWPLGDPTSADFGFCGGRAIIGLPYCDAHCRIAYQPAAERKRIRA